MSSFFPYCTKCQVKKHPGVPAIDVERVCASYPSKKDVLVDVSFKVEQATRVALLGPNGAGKSSLLKLLAGLMPITEGSIKVLRHAAAAGKHEVTYLPQRSEIDWDFPITVYKLVLTGSYIKLGWFKMPGKRQKESVSRALQLLELEHLADRQINQLSLGEQQRSLIARSLVHDGEIMLLDEPLSGVDIRTQNIVRGVFDQLKKRGKTLLMSTHDSDNLEDDFDTALSLNSGKPIEVLHKPFKF